jgi:Domain of unknown function (DUF6379)
MFADDLLPAAMRGDPARLELRLNWYRSLPLSCVEGIELAIDGEPVTDLRLRLRDFEAPVEALGDAVDVWWRVLDSAELFAGLDVPAGDHDVELAVSLRIPYYGPLPNGDFVTITDRARRTVTR